MLAAAHDLPQEDVISVTKPHSGRPPKTSKHTDDIRAGITQEPSP